MSAVLAIPIELSATSRQNPRLSQRIPELDGVRGLAILLVLICHCSLPCQIQHVAPGTWLHRFITALGLTSSGVDLFFVLSGFLIGGILYDARNSRNCLQTFYARRAFRILPVYVLWFLFFLLGLHFVGPSSVTELRAVFNDNLPAWSYLVFLQNFLMDRRQEWGALWMGVTWSLAIEEQFYLLVPVIVRKVSYKGIIWIAAAAIVFAPIFRLFLWHWGDVFYGPSTLLPSRADSLGLGVLVALACRNEGAWTWLSSHRRFIYIAFLILGCGMSFLLGRQELTEVFGPSWIGAFYTSLLLLVVVDPGKIERVFFQNRLLVRLGVLSYAVYIFHFGVEELFHIAIFGGWPPISNWVSLLVTMASLATALIMASFSWRFIEKPLIEWSRARFRYLPAGEKDAGPRLLPRGELHCGKA